MCRFQGQNQGLKLSKAAQKRAKTFRNGQKHSKKPNEVRTRIDKMFPTQNKIELFARERFDGWDAWGNEIKEVKNEKESSSR